ncbi:GIY-YIG nuclease family protein [Thermosynechococcus sichuanensis]|uniref:GIY-YIG nuclease family protein n=1 Tax=Thermosynechococcus sichuanensis TaxID=3161974 RepID=UPI000EB7577D|nr:GIY-YIG nuclease family protein [Thermosynechococcus vestitus]
MHLNRHIKSKQRVADYGEVLTPPHIVNAMLDLVKQETERIDSRFLEPACGTGNFLIEVLRRKLEVVKKRYAKRQLDYERYAVLAVSSLYGIDILADNAEECRRRLYQTFDAPYTALFGDQAKAACRRAVRYILQRNIVHGDALSLKAVGENPQPIIFSEWSLVNGSLLKRRDFTFRKLLYSEESPDTLFDASKMLVSDRGRNSRPMSNFFPRRPQVTPKIYAYADTNPQYAGLLKVGYTTKSVQERVAQQYPTVRPGPLPYRIVLEEDAIRNDGTTFTDRDVHRMLRESDIKQEIIRG